LRLAQISGLAVSHAAPLSSFARGSLKRPEPRDEHVAAIEGALQRFEDAEAVGAVVKLVVAELRVGEHEALPLPADELQRNGCGADASRARLERAQRVKRVEDWLAPVASNGMISSSAGRKRRRLG
jgi:hypothetical protein